MQTKEHFRKELMRIDHKGYKAYKDLSGIYDFGIYTLYIDHVQGDPFADPSRVRVKVHQKNAQFTKELFKNAIRKVALEDYLTRAFNRVILKTAKGNRGIGKSGLIGIDSPGQEILKRSSAAINDDYIEIRLVMGLPASGRTVLAKEAMEMFFYELPEIVQKSLLMKNLDIIELTRHIEVAEDQQFIRDNLEERGILAFVANGSILPRKSGIDDRPLRGMESMTVIPFQSPGNLEEEFNTPNRGKIPGMGIPAGITLIVGGGFHGKSTLLTALERGVYNHIPGDGREYVVTSPHAVKIRAEDGRMIEKVDITPFIQNLPFGKDTGKFSTDNASGSTSQAANIMEALEMGSRLLLIDEDTSATNFMIRDERMQRLVAKEKEPITPFVDKIKQLYCDCGVSTILVMGGSGDYFDVTDHVLLMDNYLPYDVTAKAREITSEHRVARAEEGGVSFGEITPRYPLSESFNPRRGKREVKIEAKSSSSILFGQTPIDLSQVEQLVDISQTRAIGDIIHYLSNKYVNKNLNLRDCISRVMRDLEEEGFDLLSPFKLGNYAMPRIFEVAAAINRMRTLKVKQASRK